MEEKRLTIELGAVDDWLSTCEQNEDSRLGTLCLLRGFLVLTQNSEKETLCLFVCFSIHKPLFFLYLFVFVFFLLFLSSFLSFFISRGRS
jgi:hypothetical protein